MSLEICAVGLPSQVAPLVLIFLSLLHTVFHNGYTDLCFYGQYVRVHFLLTPVRLICILMAFISAG